MESFSYFDSVRYDQQDEVQPKCLYPRYLANGADVDVFQQYRQSPSLSLAEYKEYTLKPVDTGNQLNHTFFSLPIHTVIHQNATSLEQLEMVRKRMLSVERVMSIYSD